MADNTNEQAGAVTDQHQASSPEAEERNTDTGAQVEGSEKQSSSQDAQSKGEKRRFFEERQEKKQSKQLKQENADLHEKFDALTARMEQLMEAQKQQVETPIVEESGSTVGRKEALSEADVDKLIAGRFEQVQRQQQLNVDTEQAENWLLTRSHLQNDPNAENAIASILKAPEFAGANPKVAAEAAYIRWCGLTGVKPDLEGIVDASANSAMASGTPASAATPSNGSSGSPMAGMTAEQAGAYIRKFPHNSEEQFKAADEVEAAMKAGRIKG